MRFQDRCAARQLYSVSVSAEGIWPRSRVVDLGGERLEVLKQGSEVDVLAAYGLTSAHRDPAPAPPAALGSRWTSAPLKSRILDDANSPRAQSASD